MQMNIPQISEDLQSVRTLLEEYIQTRRIDIVQERAIVDFFIKYQETNDVVSYAVNGIRTDADKTFVEFSGLHRYTQAFLDFYEANDTSLKSIDFKGDSQKYIKVFEDANKQAAAEATATWKRILELSNLLDYMMESDERYPSMRKECDEKEEQYYHVLQPLVDRTFAEYKAKESYFAPVFYFNIEMLYLIVYKINEIAKSVISDIDNLRKGGQA